MIEDGGIRVLHNRSVALARGGGSLSLAGVDDLVAGRPNLEAALEGADAPVLLLAHNPDVAFDAARRGVALMLSRAARRRSRSAPRPHRQRTWPGG